MKFGPWLIWLVLLYSVTIKLNVILRNKVKLLALLFISQDQRPLSLMMTFLKMWNGHPWSFATHPIQKKCSNIRNLPYNKKKYVSNVELSMRPGSEDVRARRIFISELYYPICNRRPKPSVCAGSHSPLSCGCVAYSEVGRHSLSLEFIHLGQDNKADQQCSCLLNPISVVFGSAKDCTTLPFCLYCDLSLSSLWQPQIYFFEAINQRDRLSSWTFALLFAFLASDSN